MKRFIILVMGVLLCGGLAAQERSDRKGFFIGFDVGGGGIHLSDGSNSGAFLGGFKIGGGLNERVLLMYEDVGTVGFRSDIPTIGAGYFSVQVFATDSIYVRPGIGFGWLERDVAGGGTLSSDLGFAAGLAVGNEWRLTRRFALSPEAKFGYLRVENGNNFSYGAALDLRWYF